MHDTLELKRARQAAGVSLPQIAARTKISLRLLQDLERGSFERWPAGLYARAWVRAYAREARLDPEHVLAMVASELRPAESWVAPQIHRRPVSGARFSILCRRQTAAIVDTLLLVMVNGLVLGCCAMANRVNPSVLLHLAPEAMSLLFGLVTICYFLLLGGVAGVTPGAKLMNLAGFASPSPLQPALVVRRAARWVLFEGSILVDLLMMDVRTPIRLKVES